MQNSSRIELAKNILQQYGLWYKNIASSQSGYRNHSHRVELSSGELVNLIIFKAEPRIVERILRADAVSRYLSKSGLPVRTRIDERIIKIQPRSKDLPSYAGIYNYLPGQTISWGSYTKDHLKALGLAMAQMHEKLALDIQFDAEILASPNIYDELEMQLERIKAYFSRSDVAVAAEEKLGLKVAVDFDRLLQVVQASKSSSRQHMLHMDFVRSNILFSDEPAENEIRFGKARISGIIDFEKTCCGSPLFDLARSLAFLYVDCKYKTALKVRKYFLYSGYIKHGRGTITSKKLLYEYVRVFLLHDFYKFLLHNPYEFLRQNEHFIRTRDILLEQNMIKYVKQD